MRSLLALPLLALVAACSADPVESKPDAHPPRNDVGPCGPTPVVFCLPGAIGRACGEGPLVMTCNGKYWECPAGTARVSDCGCRTTGLDAAVDVGAGDPCPSSDAGADALDGGDADAHDSADAE